MLWPATMRMQRTIRTPIREVSTHMLSIDNYSVRDPYHGEPLQQITRPSSRATSLLARNKQNPLLRSGFVNIIGAIEMLAGMEYHNDNFIRICAGLAKGKIRDEQDLRHEAVAYVNRMGQFYYFAKSKFVKSAVGNSDMFIPTIVKFKVFRMKHVAHIGTPGFDIINLPPNAARDLACDHFRSSVSPSGRSDPPAPLDTVPGGKLRPLVRAGHPGGPRKRHWALRSGRRRRSKRVG
jgi:hypothetical protein